MLLRGRNATKEPMPRIAASLSVGIAGRSQLVHRTRVLRPACPSTPYITTSLPIAVAPYRGRPAHRCRRPQLACAPHSRIATSLRTGDMHRGQLARHRCASWPARTSPSHTAADPRTAVAHRDQPVHSHPRKAGNQLHEAEAPAQNGNRTGKAAHVPTRMGRARPQDAMPYPAWRTRIESRTIPRLIT